MEAMEEVEVAAEQGEVEQEVAPVEEVEVGAEAEEHPEDRRRRLAIPVVRPGWSARAGTAAQAFLVASRSRSFQLLSSLKSLLRRCSHVSSSTRLVGGLQEQMAGNL